MNTNEIKSGNYKATVKPIQDGYGDSVFRMTFGYMDKGACGIDAASLRVYVMKDFKTEAAALRAANRELAKAA